MSAPLVLSLLPGQRTGVTSAPLVPLCCLPPAEFGKPLLSEVANSALHPLLPQLEGDEKLPNMMSLQLLNNHEPSNEQDARNDVFSQVLKHVKIEQAVKGNCKR